MEFTLLRLLLSVINIEAYNNSSPKLLNEPPNRHSKQLKYTSNMLIRCNKIKYKKKN